MRALSEFLTDREIFILDHHPAMSYKDIGLEFGITPERVRQIKVQAEHKVRAEKRREQVVARGQKPVGLVVKHSDLWIIIRGLEQFRTELLRPHADQRRRRIPADEIDPDLERIDELIAQLSTLLSNQEK